MDQYKVLTVTGKLYQGKYIQPLSEGAFSYCQDYKTGKLSFIHPSRVYKVWKNGEIIKVLEENKKLWLEEMPELVRV